MYTFQNRKVTMNKKTQKDTMPSDQQNFETRKISPKS